MKSRIYIIPLLFLSLALAWLVGSAAAPGQPTQEPQGVQSTKGAAPEVGAKAGAPAQEPSVKPPDGPPGSPREMPPVVKPQEPPLPPPREAWEEKTPEESKAELVKSLKEAGASPQDIDAMVEGFMEVIKRQEEELPEPPGPPSEGQKKK